MTQQQLKDYVPLKAEVEHLGTLHANIITDIEHSKGTIRGIKESLYTPLLDYYNGLINKHLAELQAVESAINTLPDWARDVLTFRYIERKDWLTISFDMYYSLSTVQRLHNKALSLL